MIASDLCFRIEESYVTDEFDPTFVKDKTMCVYLYVCIYLYMRRKRSERIYAKLFTAITSGEWDRREGGSVVVCILGMYCAFISVFEFFNKYVYFCNKNFLKYSAIMWRMVWRGANLVQVRGIGAQSKAVALRWGGGA